MRKTVSLSYLPAPQMEEAAAVHHLQEKISHLEPSSGTTRRPGWMKHWSWTGLDLFWGNDLKPTKSLLVLDAFRCYKTVKTKRVLKQKDTTLAIIPGGMNSILQPMDVSINKPMTLSLRRRWNDWMISGTHPYTKSGLRRKPDTGRKLPCIKNREGFQEVWDFQRHGWYRGRLLVGGGQCRR